MVAVGDTLKYLNFMEFTRVWRNFCGAERLALAANSSEVDATAELLTAGEKRPRTAGRSVPTLQNHFLRLGSRIRHCCRGGEVIQGPLTEAGVPQKMSCFWLCEVKLRLKPCRSTVDVFQRRCEFEGDPDRNKNPLEVHLHVKKKNWPLQRRRVWRFWMFHLCVWTETLWYKPIFLNALFIPSSV